MNDEYSGNLPPPVIDCSNLTFTFPPAFHAKFTWIVLEWLRTRPPVSDTDKRSDHEIDKEINMQLSNYLMTTEFPQLSEKEKYLIKYVAASIADFYIRQGADERNASDLKNEKTIKQEAAYVAYTHQIVNDLLTRKLQCGDEQGEGIINTGNRSIRVSEKGKKPEVYIGALCRYDGAGIAFYGGKVSVIDILVHEAICSHIKENGLKPFTAQTILNRLTGTDYRQDDKRLNEITESIEKWRHLFISINVTEEFKAWGVEADENTDGTGPIIWEDYALSLESVSFRLLNGKTVKAYNPHAAPILYRHALAVNHVISVPLSSMKAYQTVKKGQLSDPARMSLDRIALNRELCRRYEIMRHEQQKKVNEVLDKKEYVPFKEGKQILTEGKRKILYNTTFENVGADPAAMDKYQRKRARDSVNALLDTWQHKGVIQGYTVTKDEKNKKNLVGVVLELNPPERLQEYWKNKHRQAARKAASKAKMAAAGTTQANTTPQQAN